MTVNVYPLFRRYLRYAFGTTFVRYVYGIVKAMYGATWYGDVPMMILFTYSSNPFDL